MTPRFAANLSMLFTELPFRERAAAAAAAGFEGVEFWWPDEPPGDIPPGLEVVLMNFDGGDVAAGERGYLNDPARWRAHVPIAVELATSLRCMRMNALVGLNIELSMCTCASQKAGRMYGNDSSKSPRFRMLEIAPLSNDSSPQKIFFATMSTMFPFILAK